MIVEQILFYLQSHLSSSKPLFFAPQPPIPVLLLTHAQLLVFWVVEEVKSDTTCHSNVCQSDWPCNLQHRMLWDNGFTL